MRTLLAAVGMLLAATTATAQAIYDHPQKTAYASPADYPKFSTQQHWLINGTMSHVHADTQCGYRGRYNAGDLAPCSFAVVLFNGGSHVRDVYLGVHKFNPTQDVVWDATGTATRPPMDGEDGKVKVFTGHFTARIPDNVKDWWFFSEFIVVDWDDGAQSTVEQLIPFWAPNPTATTNLVSYHLPVVSARVRVFSKLHPEITYGETSVETADALPIAPISVPWTINTATYSYGGIDLPPSVSEARVDLDLHNGIPGKTLWSVTQVPDLIGMPLTFDPAEGTGTHKYAVMRTTTVFEEMHASLLVYNVTVDPNAPPVFYVPNTTPIVTEPPPPPPADWVTVSSVLQRLVDSIRICLADGKCLILGTVQ